ncbi:MAG: undecaprenyl/decaprenyl-phosphate alpha-N-acetylglucosaminyl 1-phosphate transferase [Spirochaetales bacterium]|jgi:UDP-GlcNAc:undecaprenyl-phosphate GlcNAc-1-phosphate transferase|nr:undecaprenyl/decaprenyl-phosphate alpha-N-acetylglucosaminyl 1-phosphate transferase [Spirochaetales bacterium]
MFFVAVSACAFCLQLILIPHVLKIAHKNKWYDPQDTRKIHSGNIPRTGGIGIFISLVVPVSLCILLDYIIPVKNFVFIVTGISILFLTGFLDDFENLKARYKLILQVIAAVIALTAGFHFSSLPLPFGITVNNRFITYGITLLWIVGITNALNLIDGMDGLAGGIASIAALFWGIISLLAGYTVTALLAFTLVGAVAGFLVFNRPPAKIFMGDSGSLILGYTLALLPLIENGEENPSGELLILITLLVIPVFDTIAAILRRIRLKKSIAEPDRDHLHHKFLKAGFSQKKILLIIYSFCVFSGIAALIWTLVPALDIYLLPLSWIPALILFRILHRRHWKKQTTIL